MFEFVSRSINFPRRREDSLFFCQVERILRADSLNKKPERKAYCSSNSSNGIDRLVVSKMKYGGDQVEARRKEKTICSRPHNLSSDPWTAVSLRNCTVERTSSIDGLLMRTRKKKIKKRRWIARDDSESPEYSGVLVTRQSPLTAVMKRGEHQGQFSLLNNP